MPTEEERREVARRLRERAGKRVLNLGELFWCIDCDDGDDAAAWNRLADLIEPSEPKVRCVAEVKVDGERLERLAHDVAVELTGIDRDALVALAEEMVEAFRLGAFTGEGLDAKWCRELHDKYARRVREACGVVE